MTDSKAREELACEVHVPGRDVPSPWCAACRMSAQAESAEVPSEEAVCTCAMTEASTRRCPVHGEDDYRVSRIEEKP